MSTETPTLRVVDKTHYDRQFYITPSLDKIGPLSESSVRIQSTLIGLSSNNLAYCAAGAALHWWDSFPVPDYVEAPYNDRSQYGISPGWGYATILESTVPALKKGSLLWGFFPISTFPVDLFLKQSAEIAEHFIEISPHRAKVMPLYQRYIAADDTLDDIRSGISPAAWKSMILPPWKSGYVFNRFGFASFPGDPVLHPGIGHPWTAQDGDLTKTLMICLGSGTKTGRSFIHQMATNRAPESGPVAVLEVSAASPESSPFVGLQKAFPIKAVNYPDLQSETLANWLSTQPIDRYVIVDFSGRIGICEQLANKLRANTAGPKVEVLVVGAESKVYTPEQLLERRATTSRLGAVQCNASGIREEAMTAIGHAKFFREQDAEFDKFLKEQLADGKGVVLGVKLRLLKALRGADGMEGTWDRLCQGKIEGGEGLAFLL